MELFDAQFLASQVFWTGTAFFILLAIMWFYVVPAITGVLDERANQIKSDLDHAETQRQKAEDALAEYNRQLQQAREEATQIIATARSEAQALTESKTKTLEEDLARKAAAASEQIAAARTQALADLKNEVAALVVEATEKLIGEKVDAKSASKYTDEALKSLN